MYGDRPWNNLLGVPKNDIGYLLVHRRVEEEPWNPLIVHRRVEERPWHPLYSCIGVWKNDLGTY